MKKFQTSIADICIDDEGIVNVHFFVSSFPIDTLKQHYATLSAEIGEGEKMYLYSFENLWKVTIDREARTYNNKQMSKYTSALAFASSNGMLRVFVNMYLKIANFSFTSRILPSKEECKTWLLKHHGKERVRELKKEYEEAE